MSKRRLNPNLRLTKTFQNFQPTRVIYFFIPYLDKPSTQLQLIKGQLHVMLSCENLEKY